MCKSRVDAADFAQDSVQSEGPVRVRALWFAQLLLLVPACLGGQTTVPTSLPSVCTPENAQRNAAKRTRLATKYLGTHIADVTWERTLPDHEPERGTTRLTLRLSQSDEELPTWACLLVPVIIEMSTADGEFTYSGDGQLDGMTEGYVHVDAASGVTNGTLTLAGGSIKGYLDLENGTLTFTAAP